MSPTPPAPTAGPTTLEVPGFVCAFHFDAEGRGTAVPEAALRQRCDQEAGWLWCHLNLSDQRCGRWLSEALGIRRDLLADVVSAPSRVHLLEEDGLLFGHLCDYRQEFDRPSMEHAWLHVCAGSRFLVTGRVRATQSAERFRQRIERGARFSEPRELLGALLANYPDTLETALHRLMSELEVIEDQILDDHHGGERRRLMLVRREAASLHRYLRAMRRALHLAAHGLKAPPVGLPGIVQRLIELDQDFDGLESRSRFFHDEIDAKLAAQTNRQLYILSALTAAFLPPALVAGLFGMNFSWLPWSATPAGFFIALGLCALSSAMVWLFLRSLR